MVDTVNSAPKWGVVATIKAPTAEIMEFCAHHLELGAHRLFIYLDDDNQQAFDILSAHPKIRPIMTDADYWQKLGMKRRGKHQSRQFENARHAYGRAQDVEWLTHIDVDELLWPDRDLAQILAALPYKCLCARVRPYEALAGGEGPETHFKGFSIKQPKRKRETAAIYPSFGAHLNGGFLSHVAGKMFYRTGIADLKVQIHNVFVNDQMNPEQVELTDCKLLHLHAKSWQKFWGAFKYRLKKGSYRSELKPNMPREEGGVSLHELFSNLHQAEGDSGMRRFYDEVCVANQGLKFRLADFDHLYSFELALSAKVARHFPTFL